MKVHTPELVSFRGRRDEYPEHHSRFGWLAVDDAVAWKPDQPKCPSAASRSADAWMDESSSTLSPELDGRTRPEPKGLDRLGDTVCS